MYIKCTIYIKTKSYYDSKSNFKLFIELLSNLGKFKYYHY